MNQPVKVPEDRKLLGQRQPILLFSAQPILRVTGTCASFLCPQGPWAYTEDQMKTTWVVHCTWRDVCTQGSWA